MSIRKNLTFSAILTFSTYLVPLLVFPYISRILGADCIGAIDTVDSIIDYCILISMMGMSTLGIREIAKHRDNRSELQMAFNNLFWLNAISTAIVFAVLVGATCLIQDLQHRYILLTIGSFKLLANLFWIEWFYRGLEEFGYITIRSVIVRILFIASVFIFVKEKSDFTIYYALFVGIVVLNAICNWAHKKVSLQIHGVNLKTYLKPFIMLGLFAMISAVYTKLSIPVLSFTSGDQEAGYYSTAARMYQVIIALISSLISVLIPRMSVLLKENNFSEIQKLYKLAFQILFFIAIPVVIYVEFLSPDIIYVFAGKGFDPAIPLMQVIMAQVLIIGIEQIIVLQLLIPMKQDKVVVKAGMLGMITWGILSILLVPRLQGLGTSIVWIASETAVMVYAFIHIRKLLSFGFPWKLFIASCLESIPYLIFGGIGIIVFHSSLPRLTFITFVFSIYTVILWLRKKKHTRLA